MDKSSFGADESCIPHHEDLLSSTVLVGDEDHKPEGNNAYIQLLGV